ncbi:hypothetical protein A2129_02700 [Candidatus Woesebacteria bacterium GWC1_42_13]|uniref:Glycosyltransferase 2-like domain-containing protein n=1 Tax=Candidatus Woesebacteria bacterium GWC1_42_13 TaxID=1802475 RepID=A0A1F7WUW5_9BACT|nr:MAG: hypothetical protein A2129_02700 [Candidatus Woesebacteria bacterium GWC1_42_13]
MLKSGISVVILSWNTKDITDRCLSCLKKAEDFVKDRADVEVIVIDNASNDGSGEMIAKKHPWVRLFKMKKNLGYARGNNFGFKKANPRNNYLLIINSDVYVKEKTLFSALRYLEKNPTCDAIGCRLYYEDGRFQPSAGYLPTPKSVWSWIWGLDKLPIIKNFFLPVHPTERNFFVNDRQVGWVMGAFLFMKREVFEETQGFDENFFMYMDEVEWCRRVQESGYKICYTPNFSVIHLDKASAQGDPQKLTNIYRLEILGIVYFLRKHYLRQAKLLTLVVKIGVFFRFLAFTFLGNKIRRDAYLQAYREL